MRRICGSPVGEQQHFLARQFAREQFLQPGKLGVPGRGNGGDIAPGVAQRIGIAAQVVVQPLEVIERGVERRQCVDEAARLDTRVEFFGERLRGGIVLFILARQKTRGLLKAGAVQHLALQDITFKGFQKLQCAPHADAESFDAALEAFEIAAFEDADQRLFASLLELVASHSLFLVGLQAIGRKSQGPNAAHDVVVDAAIGRLQVVADGFQPAFGPVNGLPSYRGIRISFSNERARAANHHLFEQVEEGDAALLLVGGAAGGLKIFVQVADPGGGEVTAVPAGEEGDLVVQVKDGVVDGGGREQDQLLALAAHPAAPVIGGQDALEVLVAPGVAIAEVVAFVHQQDIGVLHITTIEFVAGAGDKRSLPAISCRSRFCRGPRCRRSSRRRISPGFCAPS